MIEGMRAFRVGFNLREIFPADDPLSIPLLRLMAATNDARYIYRLLAVTIADEESGTELDRMIRAGEFCYLLRMLAACMSRLAHSVISFPHAARALSPCSGLTWNPRGAGL